MIDNCDTDKNGNLSFTELESCIYQTFDDNQAFREKTFAQAVETFSVLDLDGDGELSLEEFQNRTIAASKISNLLIMPNVIEGKLNKYWTDNWNTYKNNSMLVTGVVVRQGRSKSK